MTDIFPEFTREAADEERPFEFRPMKKKPPGVVYPDTFEEVPPAIRAALDNARDLIATVKHARDLAQKAVQMGQEKAQKILNDRGVGGKEEEIRTLMNDIGSQLLSPEVDELLYELADVLVLVRNKTEHGAQDPNAQQRFDFVMEKVAAIDAKVSTSLKKSLTFFIKRHRKQHPTETITKDVVTFPRPSDEQLKRERRKSSLVEYATVSAMLSVANDAWNALKSFLSGLFGLKSDLAELRAAAEAL